MHWKDLLYFSKGEKRALFLMLALIALALIILLVKEAAIDPITNQPSALISSESDTIIPANDMRSIQLSQKIVPAKKKQLTKSKSTTQKQPNTHKHDSQQRKYPSGTVIDLNKADTIELMKVPGIGPIFSNRIVKFRDLLGGFYHREQLQEVYGLTTDRYDEINKWFQIDTSAIIKLAINSADFKTLNRHPYLSYEQTRAIVQVRTQKKKIISWIDLMLLEEFTETDQIRLMPYLLFD